MANPPIAALAGRYRPDKETIAAYCKNKEFIHCPRLDAITEYLKATKGR